MLNALKEMGSDEDKIQTYQNLVDDKLKELEELDARIDSLRIVSNDL